MVWPDDAVDQPRLRPRRRPRAARRRRWVLSWREQRQQRRERHGLLYLDGTGRQWRHKHEHKLRRTGLGDELERREEREEVMREKRREEREERREEREEEGCRRRLSSTSNKQKPYKQSALSAPCHSTNSAFRISEGGRERGRVSVRGGLVSLKRKGLCPLSPTKGKHLARIFFAFMLFFFCSLLHSFTFLFSSQTCTAASLLLLSLPPHSVFFISLCAFAFEERCPFATPFERAQAFACFFRENETPTQNKKCRDN